MDRLQVQSVSRLSTKPAVCGIHWRRFLEPPVGPPRGGRALSPAARIAVPQEAAHYPYPTRESTMNALASAVLSIMVLSVGQNCDDAITVQIKAGKPITLTADELGKLDRTKVVIQAGDDERVYEGVCLATILQAAGMSWDAKSYLWLDCYVVAEAADGYRVVFSIPEIDPGAARKIILLADRHNGQPLPKGEGPYEIIEADARLRGRWIRQVTAIHVRRAFEED